MDDLDWPTTDEPQTWTVTPCLYLGDPPLGLAAAVVSTAAQAVEAVRSGRRAVLPRDRWDLASEVLRDLGQTKVQRVVLLMLAQNSQRIPVERLSSDELDAALRGVSVRAGRGGWLCERCGYTEEETPEEMRTRMEQGRPLDPCPVCHDFGFA